jgi:hypothetical protein
MEFKAHDPRHGRRLDRQIRVGPAGLSRGFAPGAEVRQRDAQSASAAKQDSPVKQQTKSVQTRARTLDGRFGKRVGGSAGATTGRA